MMRDFFKGWKRKAGCVTLGLACLLMVASVSSFSEHNRFGSVTSMDGDLIFGGYPMGHSVEIFGIYFSDVPANVRTVTIPYHALSIPLILASAYLLLSKPRAQDSLLRMAEHPEQS